MSPITLEAVGHLTWDVNDGRPWSPGGSVGFAARAWRGLGAAPAVITVTGPDGPPLPEARLARGSAAETTRFDNRYTPDGGRAQVLLGRAPPVRPAHRPTDWAPPAVRFLAPVLGEVDAPEWLALPARLKAVGLQGWLKHPDGGRVVHGPAGVDPRGFHGADVACLSEEDLAGDFAWLAALRRVVPRVALTRGAAGCLVYDGDLVQAVPARSVASAVDPTGAGDTFAAGLLWALAEGRALVAAAHAGAAAAAVVVARVGPAPPSAFRPLADDSAR